MDIYKHKYMYLGRGIVSTLSDALPVVCWWSWQNDLEGLHQGMNHTAQHKCPAAPQLALKLLQHHAHKESVHVEKAQAGVWAVGAWQVQAESQEDVLEAILGTHAHNIIHMW